MAGSVSSDRPEQRQVSPAASSRASNEIKEEQEGVFNPGWRFYFSIVSLMVITLMAALDATSLSVALPIMARLLKGTAIEAFWSGTSFLLTSTVFQPVVGSFSTIFGRKPLIYISLAFFLAGAIIAALADNFTIILLGRSIQGVGGGGCIALCEIVITDLVPLRQRGQWFSALSAMWSVGTVIGPLLGGGFAQNVTWRWIFWINLPFIGIAFVLIFFFLNLNFKATTMIAKLRRVDWFGTVLFVASTTGFLIPVSWGGIQYPWDSWRTLVPLLVCGAGLIGFVVWEECFAPDPLIRTSVFKNRTAAVVFFGDFIHGMILWSILYYLPLYYEAVKGFTPILAGVALFPQTFTVAPAAMIVGILVTKTGRYRWALWAGWFLTTFGMGILIYLQADTSTPGWIFLNLVSGVGTGMLFPSMALAVQAAATSEDQAYAVTMFSFFRSFGQAVGVAVGGVIFQNQILKKLKTYPLLAPEAASLSRDASGLVEIIKNMPDDNPAKDQLKDAYVYGLQYIFIVMTVLGFVAFVANLFAKGLPLDRALETEQGFVGKKEEGDEEKRRTPSPLA